MPLPILATVSAQAARLALSAMVPCMLLFASASPAVAATPDSSAREMPKGDGPGIRKQQAEPPGAGLDAERLYDALVRVEAVAVPNARSNATLGREREGTGTVITSDGVILTIGYLIVEADEIKVTDNRGRSYPAKVLGYDHATGLGLLKTQVPLKVTPVPFGNSARLADREPVLIAGWGGIPDTAMAYVVSRRPFSASWEYMLDEAIFTSPPTTGWSGAALVDRKGTIVGVGSLVVRDATVGEPKLPGNMFVPIDALKPILADMMKNGRRTGAPRPWLGVAADEVSGRLIVSRVSPDGPADKAGMQAGDIILGIAGEAVKSQSDFYTKLWAKRAAGDEVSLRVLQGMDVREIKLRSIDRVEYFKPVTTY